MHYINIFRSNNIRKTSVHVMLGLVALLGSWFMYTHAPSSNEALTSREKGVEACIEVGSSAGFSANRSASHFSLDKKLDGVDSGYVHIATMGSIIAACHPVELTSACIGSSCDESNDLKAVLYFGED